MDFEYKQIKTRVSLGNGRTFDPNSPKYNQRARVLIDDIKPMSPQQYSPPVAIPASQSVNQTRSQDPFEDIDLDTLLKTPHQHTHQLPSTAKSEEKSSFIWPATLITLMDLGLLAFSFLNQARYHHIYIGLMVINIFLVFGIFFKSKILKMTYVSYQIILIAVSIGLVIYFTINFINTNKIYTKNYKEIKNDFSSLSYQQKQNLASYQDNTIANRNGYTSQSKIFYPLMTAEIIIGSAASLIVIKRR